jgi:ketosteroid isomerase-like protein
MKNLETVQQIYANFGQGNIPAILEQLADSIEWEYGINSTKVPWIQPHKGRQEVIQFFQSLAALEFDNFQVKTLLEADNVVVGLVDVELTIKANGRRITEEDEVHIWYFDSEGKVSRFRHRVDTHQQWMALQGEVVTEVSTAG